jgi:predicted small secreted protein
VRKTSAVLATLSLAALALTGCAAAPTYAGESCDRTNTGSTIKESVTVEGNLGETPDATVYTPVHVKKTSFTDITTGEGAALTSATQPVVIDIAFFGGDSGDKLYETEFNGDLSRVHSIAYWAERSAGLEKVLECATAGTRTLAVLTPEDFGEANVQGFGMKKDENVVAVIDVLDVHLSKADGSSQFNDARGLPTVVRAADGTPGIIIPDSDAPKEGATQTLLKGDGPVVEKDSTIITNIMAVGWADKTVVSSTWGSEANIGPAAQELIGATVGSQLLVVVPESDGVTATAIVVDILGIVPVPEQ